MSSILTKSRFQLTCTGIQLLFGALTRHVSTSVSEHDSPCSACLGNASDVRTIRFSTGRRTPQQRTVQQNMCWPATSRTPLSLASNSMRCFQMCNFTLFSRPQAWTRECAALYSRMRFPFRALLRLSLSGIQSYHLPQWVRCFQMCNFVLNSIQISNVATRTFSSVFQNAFPVPRSLSGIQSYHLPQWVHCFQMCNFVLNSIQTSNVGYENVQLCIPECLTRSAFSFVFSL